MRIALSYPVCQGVPPSNLRFRFVLPVAGNQVLDRDCVVIYRVVIFGNCSGCLVKPAVCSRCVDLVEGTLRLVPKNKSQIIGTDLIEPAWRLGKRCWGKAHLVYLPD